HFLLHRLPGGRVGSSLVLLLQFLDLRLHDLHAPRCLDLAHEQGDEENPDGHRQGDDRKYPPPTALGVHPEKGEYFMRSHHDLGDNPLQGEQDLVKGSHATFSRLVASRRESLRRGDGLWTSLRRWGIRLHRWSRGAHRGRLRAPLLSSAEHGQLHPLTRGYTAAIAIRRAWYRVPGHARVRHRWRIANRKGN